MFRGVRATFAIGGDEEQPNNRFHVMRQMIVNRRSRIVKWSSAILAAIIFIVIIWKTFPRSDDTTTNDENICRSNSCMRIAEYIVEGLNKSVDPCDDFYEFACGNQNGIKGVERHVLNKNMEEALVKLIDKITDESPEYLKKLKRYYDSCVESDTSIRDLKEELDKIYAWPVLHKNQEWNEIGSEWTELIPKLHRLGFDANYFLNIRITGDKANSSRMILRLDKPMLIKNYTFLSQNFSSEPWQEYKKSIVETIQKMGVRDNIDKDVEEILAFETDLAYISEFNAEHSIITNTSIEKLHSFYPNIKWLELINEYMKPYKKFEASEVIYIKEPFINFFSDLMRNGKLSNRILANYALWRTLQSVTSGHLSAVHPRNDTKSNDFDEHNRKIMCVNEINRNMYLATSALYLKSNNIDKATSAVKNMSVYLHDRFYQMIESNDWLTEDMKNKTLLKVSKTNLLIGYPPELLNDTLLDTFYQDFNVSSDNYLINSLDYGKFRHKLTIESLKKAFNVSDWSGEYGRVAETGVGFSSYNVIFMPGGLLKEPLYYENVPNYINYAKIGFVLGHEMTHALATVSRLFDAYGNFNQTYWNETDSEAYKNRTNCFVEKYNNYSVNGTATLDENMADINGLKITYNAYIDGVKNKTESLLPGFENYTHRQMFWITFGSSLCSKGGSLTSITQAGSPTHSPEKYRVTGAVTSLKEFANDFHCKPKEDLNSTEYCSMWF